MQYISDRFRRALRYDHTVYNELTAIQGTQETNLDLLSSKVVYDYQDATHSSLDAKVIDYQNRAFPEMESLVDPFVSVFRATRGIKFPDGTIEEILLGHYYCDGLDLAGESSGYPVWTLKAFDASVECQDDLESAMGIPALPGFQVIERIIKRKLPRARFRLPRTQWNIGPLVVRPDQDPWAEARRLSISLGYNLLFERDDVLTAKVPVLTAEGLDPVWHFEEGVNSDFWSPRRTIDKGAFANVVVVQGNNPNRAGVTGRAQDNDPLSKTFVGRYKKVKTITSEYPQSIEQATAMAKLVLSTELGPQDSVTVEAIPNPALEDGDVVWATSARIGLSKTPMIVRHIELPQHADDAMQVTLGRSIITDTETGTPVRAFL